MRPYRLTCWTLSAALLAACSEPPATRIVYPEIPDALVTCADPAERRALGEGGTFRELAAGYAEAVAGWSDCAATVAEVGRLREAWPSEE